MDERSEEDQQNETEPQKPPVDGPGTGSEDEGLGDTSQDSPGGE